MNVLTVSGQYISVQENLTVEQLVNDVLIDNPCASGSNVVMNGWTFGSGGSYGSFSANGSAFPFSSGIILSTGRAASAPGPNTSLLSEGPTNWAGDADLEQALNVGNTINATVLEFDFLPLGDKFSFDYIFSSEQYLTNPSANQCNYTDGFAFLLKKANTSEAYQNLALVPNTNIPVRVNTVRGPGTICPEANAQWFDAFNDLEHPTNFNGQTRIMTAGASVEPGTLYHIKIVIADQGNNLYDSALFLGAGTFRVTKDLGPDRLIATNNPLCSAESLTLDATQTGAVSYQWFNGTTPLTGETSAQYTVNAAGIYAVEIDLGTGCFATGEIEIEYAPAQTVDPIDIVQCDPDGNGTSVFNLDPARLEIESLGFSVSNIYPTVTDATLGQNEINPTNAYAASGGSTVVASITNGFGCTELVPINLLLSTNALSDVTIAHCDDQGDGVSIFYFSEIREAIAPELPGTLPIKYYASMENALSGTNALTDPFLNTIPLEQTIYAVVENGLECYGIATVHLTVFVSDLPPLQDESVHLCTDDPYVLSVPAGFDSYEWSGGETSNQISVTSAGIYTVTIVSTTGCSTSKTFTVTQTIAPVFVTAQVQELSGNDNSINVVYEGAGPYEFSIDGNQFQPSPFFGNLNPGAYEIYIREPECGIVIGPYAVYLIDYPKFFTPNADGYHDFWRIPYLPAGSTVRIFDRYGRLLKSLSGTEGWDGTFRDRPLPSSDYWFVLDRPGHPSLRAHFSLKR